MTFNFMMMARIVLLLLILIKVLQKPQLAIKYGVFLPIIFFLLYPELIPSPTNWQQVFTISAAIAVIATALQVYFRVPLDRIILGVNLFLATGALAFLVKNETVLNFLDAYNGVSCLLGVLVVGIIATLFSESGFFATPLANKSETTKKSLVLVAATAVALIWSFLFNAYGPLVSAALPIVVLTFLRKQLSPNDATESYS